MMCSGSSTGEAACPDQLDLVLGGVPDTPVLIGSGVTTENLAQFSRAHGLIVGSYFKHGGAWQNSIDEGRLGEFLDEARRLRSL